MAGRGRRASDTKVGGAISVRGCVYYTLSMTMKGCYILRSSIAGLASGEEKENSKGHKPYIYQRMSHSAMREELDLPRIRSFS